MADMSQVNLERLRATDAMWEENKHPRADNGQFTSGSGGVSATGGGAKFHKPTASMTTGKFKKPNAEASKIIAEGAKNKEKPQAIIRKANAELNKGEAARKTLNRSKGKINAMRSLAEAATPYHAESQQASVDKFKNVEQMLKKVDKVAASYAGKLAKAAEKGGESAAMAAAEKLNAYIDKQDASDFVKGYHRGRLQLALREYNKGGLKQRKDKMEAELKAKAAKPSYEELTKRQNDLFHKTAEASRKYGPGSPEHKAARAEYDKAYAEWEKADNERQGTPEDKNWVRRKLGKEKYDDLMEKTRRKPGAQPAAKPQASHPMAAEVQKDIDYWHQMQYGGRPSEKQKQDTIESMRMQYDDYLKTAEKNWKLAQSVPNLDDATRNKYQQKYEAAKGKADAFKQLYG